MGWVLACAADGEPSAVRRLPSGTNGVFAKASALYPELAAMPSGRHAQGWEAKLVPLERSAVPAKANLVSSNVKGMRAKAKLVSSKMKLVAAKANAMGAKTKWMRAKANGVGCKPDAVRLVSSAMAPMRKSEPLAADGV